MSKAAVGILCPLPKQYPTSFLNFFKAPLLDDSAAVPARMIVDTALKYNREFHPAPRYTLASMS